MRPFRGTPVNWPSRGPRVTETHLRLVNVDAPGVPQHRVLVDDPEIQWIWPEDWTPDGKKIVVGVQRMDGSVQIALVATSDGAMSVLKSLERRDFLRMALSPSGDGV